MRIIPFLVLLLLVACSHAPPPASNATSLAENSTLADNNPFENTALENSTCASGLARINATCCSDVNRDGRCDPGNSTGVTPPTSDTAALPAPEPAAPPKQSMVVPPTPREYSAVERAQLLSATARDVARLLEEERYAELFASTETNLSRDDFVFALSVIGPAVRVRYDASFRYVTRVLSYNPDTGLALRLGEAEINGTYARIPVNATYGGVTYRYPELRFSWHSDHWLLVQPFNGTTPASVCSSLNYSQDCIVLYAQSSGDTSLCAQSGDRVIACFAPRPVSASAAIAACSSLAMLSSRDACLTKAALSSGDSSLCNSYAIPINSFECLGVLAAGTGKIDDCLLQVNQSSSSRAYAEDLCYLGYAQKIGPAGDCSPIKNVGVFSLCAERLRELT